MGCPRVPGRSAWTDATASGNGRYRLTANGRIVVPARSAASSPVNPRTIADATRDGKIVPSTLDGCMTTSVATPMDETTAVADVLGMYDAVAPRPGPARTPLQPPVVSRTMSR